MLTELLRPYGWSFAGVDVLLLGVAWVLVVAGAVIFRNRFFATFVGVYLGVVSLVWAGLARALTGVWEPLALWLQLATFVHFVMLVRPRMRPLWYRALVSLPGLWCSAAVLLAVPWAIAAALGFPPYGWWLPFAVCLIGLLQSLRNPRRDVSLVLDDKAYSTLQRVPHGEAPETRPLRLVQISDPHLGPFMSERRLHAICQRAVAMEPDLVLITGDFVTMESQGEHALISRALSPLAAIADRTFACLGNHDHEAPQTVARALRDNNITLLVDEHTRIETPIGPVDIIGADFVWRQRQEHLAALFAKVGPRDGTPRILMLHDPGAFKYVPEGAADLTLSGHTHGGQLGLVSFGLVWTLVGAVTPIPEHGYWAQGSNRLYVHRGTGHYGFPIRLGVPGEEGLLQVFFSHAS